MYESSNLFHPVPTKYAPFLIWKCRAPTPLGCTFCTLISSIPTFYILIVLVVEFNFRTIKLYNNYTKHVINHTIHLLSLNFIK